jgi:small subunit ribosomal protein S17
MAEEKNTEETTDETAATPEVVEETTPEAPAAEAETPAPVDEEPVAEAEGPAEIEAEVDAAEAEAVEEPVVESDSAAEPEAEAAEAAPAEEPAAPAKKTKSNRHVPRSQRRQRSKPAREKPAERKPIVRGQQAVKELGRHQERRGIVVSDAMDKTIVVKVEVIKIHPRYKKVIRRSRKFHAHDEQNQAHVGDTVRIVETRPLSKTKNWRLAEVVEVAK